MGEAGWQAFPGVGAPVEVAAAEARGAEAGFGVGNAAFASPDTGWVCVGDGEAAQCRVLFTEDAGATWRPQLAWWGLFYGRLAAFGERQATLGLAVAQGDDINGYRPEPHPPGDPFIGPDAFLAGTEDAGATWTLAPTPNNGASSFHFLTPRQVWLVQNGLIRTRDGGVTWQLAWSMAAVWGRIAHFQSEAEGLLVATGERDRVDVLYQTANGGISWERVPLDFPPGLLASAGTLLEPVAGPDGGMLLVLKARSRSGAERRPRWEGSYAYRPDGQRGWGGRPRPVRRQRPGGTMAAPPGAAAGRAAHHPAVPGRRRGPVAGHLPVPGAAAPNGQLYRSADDGAHWTRILGDGS